MEETYEKLKAKGFNTVDNIIQWMKQAEVISPAPEAENAIRKLFNVSKDPQDVQLVHLMHAVYKLADVQERDVESVCHQMAAEGPGFYDALEALATRILEEAQEAEDEVRRMFDDVADKSNVGLEKFMQVLEQMAVESDRTTNELVSMLEHEGPKLLNAFEAAIKAFTDALK